MTHLRHVMLLMMLLVTSMIYAQKQDCAGVVLDPNGEPIIGATILEKGTQNGTATDLDGRFALKTAAGATITVSYVGYNSQELKATSSMRIVLKEDAQMLNDVIVIGYGVQKKSVVTASIAKVDADDLNGKAPVRVDNALKGLAAGVNVTSNSGQPGAAARIRVRGTGTINNSDPLYIIDGIPYEGSSGIDMLNPNDIESIEVLKDAASGAIYGARAANGVILVTTKKGSSGKVQVNYNFSYGWQNKWRKRDVLSATDYAILQNEQYVNSGQAPLYADPYNLVDINGNKVTTGTDWQDEVFNDNAPVMNHDVSIAGGNDRLKYYLSMGYYDQEGIVGGNYGHSNYDRLTLRSNTNYNLFDATKERSWLNKLDISTNLAYARVRSTSIDVNSTWGSVLGSTLALSPILPTYVTGQAAIDQHNKYYYTDYSTSAEGVMRNYADVTDAQGRVVMIPGTAYNEMNNPLGILLRPASPGWSHHFTGNFSADLNIWDTLKYHFSYMADMSFWGSEGYTASTYYNSGNNNASSTSASFDEARCITWQLENTLSYDKTLGKHHFNIVLGQSALSYGGYEVTGSRKYLINSSKPSVTYANGDYRLTYDNTVQLYTKDADGNYSPAGYKVTGASVDHTVTGYPYNPYRMSSIFARASYDYDERYMAQVTIRRDGSSRFGSNNKYGTFPSVSLGWNVMNEAFMENTRDYLSNLKLRLSWGKNGNDQIGDFRYTVNTQSGNNYYFGNPVSLTLGSKANGLANSDLKWEESEQTDIGLDFGFFQNALTFTVDYFKKRTNGMLMTMNIPSYVGESKPLGNVGDMENSGLEFELGYKFRVADAKFQVKGNASYLHNELIQYGNETGYADLDNFQGVGTITRAENGHPFPFFYGYKTAGIFQTMDEVRAYTTADGTIIQPNAQPGDVRFVDLNGDGVIDANDKTDIGNGTPKWSFGLNVNAEWRGFDFNMFWQGVADVDVFDATHRTDIASSNYPSWMLSRWTGPGTSNKVPRLFNGDANNWQSSDLYIFDGSYLRLKNISLGYTLPQQLTKRFFVERLRFYVMAENLFTWTRYHGFDPEIASGGTSLGVDYGVYPQARTWTVGFNLTF